MLRIDKLAGWPALIRMMTTTLAIDDPASLPVRATVSQTIGRDSSHSGRLAGSSIASV